MRINSVDKISDRLEPVNFKIFIKWEMNRLQFETFDKFLMKPWRKNSVEKWRKSRKWHMIYWDVIDK